MFLKRCLNDLVEVNPMKQRQKFTLKNTIFAALILIGALWFLIHNFFDSNTPLAIPTALAQTQYGILGQLAPELNLSDWIDGNGKKTETFRLSDYRGKVVYLYFFQERLSIIIFTSI